MRNAKDIMKLKADHKELSTQLANTEQSFQNTRSKLEASIVELEDRSRQDNVCIINLPEKAENGDAAGFISSSLPKWFPSLAGEKMEVMRAHCIGLECSATGGPCTLICKMLRYMDHDRILKAARGAWTKVNGKEVHFAADYSNFTIKRRCALSQAMESARKLCFSPFLIYPAKLKLSRGSEVHLFKAPVDAEGFLDNRQQLDNFRDLGKFSFGIVT